MRSEWADARRIVVKIGSALLVDNAAGVLRAAWLDALCDDIAELRRQGKEVILVSSGAIALGRNVLMYACRSGVFDTVKALIEGVPADLVEELAREADVHGSTALMAACVKGSEPICSVLLAEYVR